MPNFCTTCGSPLKPSQKFCTACGTEIRYSTVVEPKYQRQNCPSCGAFANPDAKFCTKCGTEFGKEIIIEPVAIPVEKEPYSVSVSDDPVLENTVAENLCNACGASLNLNAKFCTKCGAKAEPAAKREQNKATSEKWTQAAKKVAEMLEQTLDATDFAGEMRIPVNGTQQSVISSFIKKPKI